MDELRKNPETGDVERKVVSYEKVELAQLQGEVDNLTAAVESTNTELEGTRTRVTELEAQLSSQESELAAAKSQLDAYNQVAGTVNDNPDAGTEVTESAVEAAPEGEPVEVTVTDTPEQVETPEFV